MASGGAGKKSANTDTDNRSTNVQILTLLGGRTAAATSAPFDNSAVAGGFVVWQAEWARQAGEREVIRQALQDAASAPEDVCLEIELCRVAGAFNSALTAP